MDLKIASRKSDLARIQSLTVGKLLKAAHPQLNIIYEFRASLGDKNLNDPLWKMPQKGVFTEDFLEDLITGRQDMVVHSWKDLPTEGRAETEIYATLPREDVRDLLLFRVSSIEKVRSSGRLICFSSSPRRIYNLAELLPRILPWEIRLVEFQSVRGNVPTRIDKLLSGDADVLIVAKAAMDRLLTAEGQEFAEMQTRLREQLRQLQWMVLPVKENPPAAAQGALAIEIRRDRQDLKELLDKINCRETHAQVRAERQEFKSYGGGCHQKIGLIRLRREYGEIHALRGKTEAGQELREWQLIRSRENSCPPARESEIFPAAKDEAQFFTRESLPVEPSQLDNRDWWIAKAEALPEAVRPSSHQAVWCAGMHSWQKLAKRGIWVNGCAESLGEREDPRLEALLGRLPRWLKLSHEEGVGENVLPTYRLVPKDQPVDLQGKKYFYWMSGSQFLQALKWQSEIADGYHACGPGHTYDIIARYVTNPDHLRFFLSYEEWRNEVLK